MRNNCRGASLASTSLLNIYYLRLLIAGMMTGLFIHPQPLLSQSTGSTEKKETEELRWLLNSKGDHYIKLTILGQLWLRYNQHNPGSVVLKKPASGSFDIGIRRLRMQFYGQLSDHAFFYIHIGQDNFNYLSARKFTPFIQDALAEYKVKKGNEALIIGAGLTILSGLSRFTQPQLPNIMTTDLPIFVFPTFELTDQAGRKLSLYLRGQIGKLDYRLAMANPFPVSTSGTALPALSANGYPITPNADFAQQGNQLQYQGLFIWNFFDREPHVSPFMPGTYYGKKKVLNIEAGFITQNDATWSSNDAGITANYHRLNCWSAAVFYDAPVNKSNGTALNAYAGYFSTQYGNGYLRYVGAMNPADGPPPSATHMAGSQGNAFPMYGNGHVFYSQIGYLLKKDCLGKNIGTLMPYISLQTASYDRLDKSMTVVNTGINWMVKNIQSKISFDYQNRPVYAIASNHLVRTAARKSQWVVQYQFFF